MSTLFERVTEGRRRAELLLAQMETVGTRYVVDLEEGVGCYDVTENEVHEMVTEFVPPEHPIKPGKTYNFISGIEAMRDGGPTPDWTGCGRAFDIRGHEIKNPWRYRYELALSQRFVPDVLYNPSRSMLYMYPNTPVFFSGTQKWHEELSSVLRDEGRVIRSTLDQEECLLSFDTWDRTLPQNWKMLVPHPTAFRQGYGAGECSWDGRTLTYQWDARYFHKVSFVMGDYYYYSTAQTDRLLGRVKDAEGAYWIFQSAPTKQIQVDSYRPSFHFFSSKPEIWTWHMPYLSYCKLQGSMMGGDYVIDLDQTFSREERTSVYLYPSQDVPLGGIWDGKHAFGGLKLLTLLLGDSPGGDYIPELKCTLKFLPGKYSNRKWYVDRRNESNDIIAVFGDRTQAYTHMMSVYWMIRGRLRTIGATPIRLGFLPIGVFMGKEGSLVDLVAKATAIYGERDMVEWKVHLRKQGSMIVRYKQDRYVMKPRIPYVRNAVELWNTINTSRAVTILFRDEITAPVKQILTHIMRRNVLVSYWDDQVLRVIDPYADSVWSKTFVVDSEGYTAPLYVEFDGHRYYYPYRDSESVRDYFKEEGIDGVIRDDGQLSFYLDDDGHQSDMAEDVACGNVCPDVFI